MGTGPLDITACIFPLKLIPSYVTRKGKLRLGSSTCEDESWFGGFFGVLGFDCDFFSSASLFLHCCTLLQR